LMGCPNEVFEKQLRETHIKIRDWNHFLKIQR
jgi:hypothetical protein